MEAIMMPVIVLGMTGIAMGLFLAFASKKFEVEVDPKVEQILAILPGINCGACGCPGCSGYASAVVEEGASMTLCTPGGPKVMEKIGEIMGVAVEAPVKKKKPAKKKKVKKAVAVSAEPISASKEFIDKNRKMLEGYKEAVDNGDKEKQAKLEKLATMTKKEELLKCFEELKAGKVIDGPKAVEAISASKEFIDKNRKMLEGYKEAIDGGDKEKQTKLEKLATMTKKEELLKCFEELKAGKVIDAPVGAGVVTKKEEPISASKEFIEKNKKMLESFKEAFDDEDKEKQEKLTKLATMAKKEELLKYYEEIKAGKIIPDPQTMKPTSKEEPKGKTKKQEVKQEVKKEEPVQVEVVTKEEKEEQASSYCSVLGDGLCVPELQEEMKKEANPLTEILEREKVENPKIEEKQKEEEASASSNIYEYASHISEKQEEMRKKEESVELPKEEKVEIPKTKEEKLAEEQAVSYCSVLGDGLCVPEELQQQMTLEENLDKKMD
ncbi:MAG: electron transporter RnfB [Fusobacteriales bacterium]|nr:MAG: electron transporter RnfB [Fusobacteriales bacterium]